jgi:hypothetical protein
MRLTLTLSLSLRERAARATRVRVRVEPRHTQAKNTLGTARRAAAHKHDVEQHGSRKALDFFGFFRPIELEWSPKQRQLK